MGWLGRLLIAMGVGLWIGGCGREPEPAAPPEPPKQQKWILPPGVGEKPAEPKSPTQPSSASSQASVPQTIPSVKMDTARRATFRVWIGQQLPAGQFLALQGQSVSLEDLRGEALTVLVFWNSKTLSGLQQLQDLAKDLLPKYQDKGIQVLAINVGEQASEVPKALPPAASSLPVLLDPQGKYFAEIAQPASQAQIELLPRTYVVDSQGKVLWLDIGYSDTTLRNIETCIQVVLGKKRKT